MNPIDLKATNTTPAIVFNQDRLIIKGRSIPLSEAKFYDPFIDWAKKLKDTEKLTVDVNLEYMNSSSSKKLLQFLKTLDDNRNISNLFINWFFEEGDEELKEQGMVFEKLMKKARFRFLRTRD